MIVGAGALMVAEWGVMDVAMAADWGGGGVVDVELVAEWGWWMQSW